MNTIIPPGNTNLVTSDCRDNYDGYKRYDNKDYCQDFANLNNNVADAAYHVSHNDNLNSHHSSASAERFGFAGINVADRNGADTRHAVDRNGADTRSAVRDEAHETRAQSREYSARSESYGFRNFEATKDAFKDLLISTKDDLKAVLISNKDDMRDLLVSQKNDAKELLLKIFDSEKDILLQFKDTQLQAVQNKCELAAKIAECCCEQKELIRAQNELTRDLVSKIEVERIRDQFRDSKEELIALRMRASLLPPLTGSVSI